MVATASTEHSYWLATTLTTTMTNVTENKATSRQTDTEVDYADTCKSQDAAHWRTVLHVASCHVEIVHRIHRCHVSKPDHWQEEDCCKVLENWTDLSNGLNLVPLVRNEVSAPDGSRHISRAAAAKWNDFTLRSFPVDEENINASLSWQKIQMLQDIFVTFSQNHL